MKRLKFKSKLIPKILSGEKTVTWRLFDDKNLVVGDELEFVQAENGEVFGSATITQVDEKALGATTEGERLVGGWKTSIPIVEIVAHYQQLYGQVVTPETLIKIITFRLADATAPVSTADTTHYRDLEKRPTNRESKRPAAPLRPNHMAYRAVSRPPAPGGGK